MNQPENFHKPIVRILHANLQRVSDESPYRSACPVCKHGMLLVYRDQSHFHLIREDRCTICGQGFFYADLVINGEMLPMLTTPP